MLIPCLANVSKQVSCICICYTCKSTECTCTCEKENRKNSNARQKQTSKSACLKAKHIAQTSSTFISPIPTKRKQTKKNDGDEIDSIQIAKYLLEGKNITMQDAQRLAKSYLRLVEPEELYNLDDEYEIEKETDEYVAGLKPSDGIEIQLYSSRHH